MGKEAFETLSVLRSSAGRAHRCAHHHWNVDPSARHIAHLGGLIDHLVHAAEQEVTVLKIGDGTHPGHGGAYRHPSDQNLRYRSVQHPIITKLSGRAADDRKAAAVTAVG